MDPETLERLRRQSGLALTKDGVWTWGGKVAENERVQALFHRGVAVREDGELTLSVGRMWTYFAAEATVFFVRAVVAPGDEVRLRLLGDREVRLDERAAAGWGPDERLYLWVLIDGVPRPAICLREAHQALAARLVEHQNGVAIDFSGEAGMRSGGATDDRAIPVVPLRAIPAAAAPPPVVSHNATPSSPEA